MGEVFAGMYSIVLIVIVGVAVGTFFALPMIWYHVGFVSRKLDTTNSLLRKLLGKIKNEQGDSEVINDDSFKRLTKDEAIKKWRDNPIDNRKYREIIKLWQEDNQK